MTPTKVYKENLSAWDMGKRLIANRGGTRSGKTYSIVCLLVTLASYGKPRTIDIVSESLPHLKRGVLNDIEDILNANKYVEDVNYTLNRSDHIYTFTKGSSIRIFSADDWGKVKGSRRDILFINECNRIPYEVYRQLAVRTTETIFMDWNPDAEFWYEINGLKDKESTVEIHSTYLDNPYLSPQQIEEIESNKGDAAWWKVYGLGEVGRPQGVIFDRWETVDEVPEGARLVGFGLDFGFSCFKGNTMIMTEKGLIPISEIKCGDMVLTRQGYRRVVRKFENGVKEVVTKRIYCDKGVYEVSATDNHYFNINGKWKKYVELQKMDRLCVLSHLKGKSIRDTQVENIQITTTTNGKKMVNTDKHYCIMRFMNFIKGKSQKVISFIILMVMHLIIRLITLLLSLSRNIAKSMIFLKKQGNKKGGRGHTTKIIGMTEEKLQSNDYSQSRESVNGAVRNILRQMFTSGFALNNVIISGSTNPHKISLKWFANIVGKCFMGINILSQRLAVKIVPIKYSSVIKVEEIKREYCTVYDLQIDGVHEYFANGILVHNCDPTAIVAVYLNDGKLWLDELCYKRGMTNDKIADFLRGRQGQTVADSAEMKSITEIYNYGIRTIEPAKKGADSVRNGIDVMRRYEMRVTKRSLNLIYELRNYKWKEDKITGELTGEPVDKFNHLIDAARYVCLNKLAERPAFRRPRGLLPET